MWGLYDQSYTPRPPTLRKLFMEIVPYAEKNLSWVRREVNPGVHLLNLETANETDTNTSYGSQLHQWTPVNYTWWHGIHILM